MQGPEHHPARGPEEEVVGDRRSHHLSRELQGESEGSQACGVDLRVDEDCGRLSSESVSRSGENRTVWRVGGYCVQSGENVEVDSRGGGQSPHRRIGFPSRGVSVRHLTGRLWRYRRPAEGRKDRECNLSRSECLCYAALKPILPHPTSDSSKVH